MKFSLCMIAACAIACSTAFANDGVNTEERIVNLPQDQAAWYISVVGSGVSYANLVNWFAEDKDLARIKSQVKFRQVDANSEMFKARYQENVYGLPTIRMQKPDGTVVYEAAGNDIPYTSQALYGALADSASNTEGILRPWRHGGRPWLPWRRHIDRQLRANPNPQPCPAPQPVEPVPSPSITPIGPPKFVEPEDEGVSGGMALLLSLASLLGGGGAGVVSQFKSTYSEIV